MCSYTHPKNKVWGVVRNHSFLCLLEKLNSSYFITLCSGLDQSYMYKLYIRDWGTRVKLFNRLMQNKLKISGESLISKDSNKRSTVGLLCWWCVWYLYLDAKKQSQMSQLSKQRDNLQKVINTYRSLFDTTDMLTKELESKFSEDVDEHSHSEFLTRRYIESSLFYCHSKTSV